MFNILAEDATTSGSSNNIIMIVILAVLMVGMLLMSIIPQKKRQKKAQEMMDSIKVNTKVKTIGGFVGVIKAIDSANNTFTLDISANEDGSTMVVMDKSSIYTVLTPMADGTIVEEKDATPQLVAEDDVVAEEILDEKKKNKKDKKSKKQEETSFEADTNDLEI